MRNFRKLPFPAPGLSPIPLRKFLNTFFPSQFPAQDFCCMNFAKFPALLKLFAPLLRLSN
jgi:hypothetical protein